MNIIDKLITWNYLKTTLVFVIVIIGIALWLWHRNTTISNIASVLLTILAFVILLSNNFVEYQYREYEELKAFEDNYTISQNDRDFILNNYPYVARAVKSPIPTSHYEDGDFDVSNNKNTYKDISVRVYYYVHKVMDSENSDVSIYEFYSYFTTNGESIIEGSSHLHDFNKVYLYRYQNESTYFAIGYSTYNYDSYKHEWIIKRKKELITSMDHPILLIDPSTNEYSMDQVADPTKRIDNAYLTIRELSDLELIIVIVSYGIAVLAIVQIGDLWYNPKKHIWYYILIVFLVIPVFFMIRGELVYHSEFSMEYWNIGQTPGVDFWREGQTYIDIYGGPPWMKGDWSSYTISENEDLYNLYLAHKQTTRG